MNASWQRLLSATSARWSEDGALLDFGHPEQELEGAVFEPVVCPLSDMAVIEVSGADALTFLQNQLSNDLRDLADGASRLAAYCTPKGRMLALFRVIRRGGPGPGWHERGLWAGGRGRESRVRGCARDGTGPEPGPARYGPAAVATGCPRPCGVVRCRRACAADSRSAARRRPEGRDPSPPCE